MGILPKLKYMVSGATGRIGRSPRCPSCGSCRSEQVDRKYFHALLLCSECKLLHRYPCDNPEEMRVFYEDGYAEPGLTTDLPSDAELRVLIDTGFRGSPKDFSYQIEILRALGLNAGSRVLDFGANWGYSTWQFHKAGFDAEGFELSQNRAAFGLKLDLDICTDASKLRPPYDVVYSSHVLEHVPNPSATLHQQLSMLRLGGLVVAHTPNGSAAYRQGNIQTFHRSWGQVHPVLLSDNFVANAFARYPYLITSDDRPEELRKWDQSSQIINECSQSGFFFAVKRAT